MRGVSRRAVAGDAKQLRVRAVRRRNTIRDRSLYYYWNSPCYVYTCTLCTYTLLCFLNKYHGTVGICILPIHVYIVKIRTVINRVPNLFI